ncbi:hypothetical protein ABG768_014037, partial [Culter alburnus]
KKSSTACHPESVKSSIHVLVVLMYQPTSRISGFVLVIYGPILAGHFITITAKPTTRQRVTWMTSQKLDESKEQTLKRPVMPPIL